MKKILACFSKKELGGGRFLVPLLFVLLTGCASSLSQLGIHPIYDSRDTGDPPGHVDTTDHIQVTYLGTSGFLIRRGREAIVTDPFFSNPRFFQVVLGSIHSKCELIDKYLPPVEDVVAILVSHAHYDHLMDVPYVAKKAERACVYSSLTGKNILAPSFMGGDASRLKSILGDADPPFVPWSWIQVSPGIRFMPILSEHAPHLKLFSLSLYDGSYSEPLDKIPGRAAGYRKGRVFSFVIDFVDPSDPDKVDFRIYFQGAAAGRTHGSPPIDLQDFDLAILSAGNFHKVQEYPSGILKRLRPTNVLVSHWEDFFLPSRSNLKVLRGTNVGEFLDKVEAQRKLVPEFESWLLPKPGGRIVYPIFD